MTFKGFYITIALLLYNSFILAQDASQLPELKTALLQAKNDTDKADVLTELCFHYSSLNADTALMYGSQALQLSVKKNYTKGLAGSYNAMGWTYYRNGNTDTAESYFLKAIQLFKEAKLTSLLGAPYNNLGILYMDKTDYAKSMNYLMQALHYEEIQNDTATETQRNTAITLHDIGRLYNILKKPDDARKYFEQSLQISRAIHADANVGENLMSIGNTYLINGDANSALKYYNETLTALQHTNDLYRIGLTYEDMGASYDELEKYDLAAIHLNKAKQYYTALKSKLDIATVCLDLAEVYHSLKDYNREKAELNEASLLAKQINDKKLQLDVALELSKFYKEHNDYQKAYQYLDSSTTIKDSLFTIEKQNAYVKMQTQFETVQKEKEIALLKKEQQLSESNLQRQKTFQYAAYIILFLLALLGILIINRYRLIQRSKRRIEMEQMRNNIARNLHDDIGSTLTSINLLSKVALRQTEGNTDLNDNMQKIKDRSATVMENMSDIVWAVNPANDTLDRIILRMKEFSTETLEQAGIRLSFTDDPELANTKLAPTQRNNLYLIFKETLNNAIKYSNATEVYIELKKEQAHLILTISDNGKGFDKPQQCTGNGLKNMQSRADEMKALMRIESKKNEGVTMQLSIPIT